MAFFCTPGAAVTPVEFTTYAVINRNWTGKRKKGDQVAALLEDLTYASGCPAVGYQPGRVPEKISELVLQNRDAEVLAMIPEHSAQPFLAARSRVDRTSRRLCWLGTYDSDHAVLGCGDGWAA